MGARRDPADPAGCSPLAGLDLAPTHREGEREREGGEPYPTGSAEPFFEARAFGGVAPASPGHGGRSCRMRESFP